MATEALQPYRDLRSASRVKHRERARNVKYNSFRTVHASDLPSKLSSTSQAPHIQQEHYLPVCAYPECPTIGTADGHIWSSFPADLSEAPVAKFTAREALQVAVPRYRRHHADKYKNLAKQARQRHFKKLSKRELREDPQWESHFFGEMIEDYYVDSMSESERYLEFGEEPEIFESWSRFTEYGETLRLWCLARSTTPSEHLADYLASKRWKRGNLWEGCEFEWSWYRNLTGCWVFSIWDCHRWYCDCPETKKRDCMEANERNECTVECGHWTPEGPQNYSLARWCKGMIKDGVLWDTKEEMEEEEEATSSEDLEWDGDGTWSDFSRSIALNRDADWDMVSVTSSAWTEIQELENRDSELAK
jgi:hypothetical protein